MARACVICLLLFLIAACGDDDAAPADAGSDAARDDAGDSGGFIPRRDSSVAPGDPIPDCDPLNPLACGAGQKCDWVLRYVTTDSATVYTACVREGDERERGVPCEQWSRAINADGLTQPAYVDPCGEGLFCFADPKLRDVNTCQPLCHSPSVCDDGAFCSERAISPSINIPVPICRPSDDCDAIAQSGCTGDRACYLRPNTFYDGALAVCLAHFPQMQGSGAPGDPCFFNGAQYISACQAGAVCWGDPSVTPDQWADTDIRCRSYCDPMQEPGDADAGAGPCGSGQCVWLGDPGLGLNNAGLTQAPGVCD